MDTNTTPATTVIHPGQPSAWPLTLRNEGSVVDAFTFEPLGDLAPWASVEPAELGLLPGEERVVAVQIVLPRDSSVAAGPHPIALRVISREAPDSTRVEEGLVEVAPFVDVTAELGPRISIARGQRRGRHQLAVDNRGNTAAQVRLDLLDPQEQVRGTLDEATLEIGPGQSQLVTVKVHARHQSWRGANTALPFEVLVEPLGAEAFVAKGRLLQRPVFPSWFGKAVLALVALAVVGSGLWLAVLKPTIQSSARSAAAEESAQAMDTIAQTSSAQQKAAEASAQRQDKAIKKIQDKVGKTPVTAVPGQDGTPVDPLGDPVAKRIAAGAGDQSPSIVLDPAKIVSITDLLLQNPEGNVGVVRITQNGATVYVARLENFRDLDLHLVAPLSFAPGDTLGLEVSCKNAPEFGPCTPGVTVSGFGREPSTEPQP